MGTQTQKKQLSEGMSSTNVRLRLLAIFAEKNPGIDLDQVNKEFAAKYEISLFSLCEIWHGLRTQNLTLESATQAFAEKLARKNKEISRLGVIVTNQREQLRHRLAEIDKLKGETS